MACGLIDHRHTQASEPIVHVGGATTHCSPVVIDVKCALAHRAPCCALRVVGIKHNHGIPAGLYGTCAVVGAELSSGICHEHHAAEPGKCGSGEKRCSWNTFFLVENLYRAGSGITIDVPFTYIAELV